MKQITLFAGILLLGAGPATAWAEEPAATIGYSSGFFIRSGDESHSIKIQGRVQPRWELERDDGGDTETAFSIARARLGLEGHVYSKDIAYKFQADFGKGEVTLKDFYVDYRIVEGRAGLPLHVRAGQFKRPFSRQQINSSGRLELVDRSITDRAFQTGRDIGVAVHNDYERSPRFEWALGVFNGTGDKPIFGGGVVVDPMTGSGEVTGGGFSNVPARMNPSVVARAGYNHNGIRGYSEADLEGGPLRFAVGASSLVELDGNGDDRSAVRAQADYALKAHGFSTTGGVYLATAHNGNGLTDPQFDAAGFHLQAGYLLGGRYQPTVRYALVNPRGPQNHLQEILAGFSVYSIAHNFKWQIDGGVLTADSMDGSRADVRVRSQLQLVF